MAKTIDYTVTLYPAEIKNRHEFSFLMFDPKAVKRVIQADSLDNLRRDVCSFAHEFGQDCISMIGLPRGSRKPNGFDRSCEIVRVLPYTPVQAESES